MRRPLALLVVVGAAIVLPACATRGSVRQVNVGLEQIRHDISEIRTQQQVAGREGGSVALELRVLSGRLRETEARLRDTLDRAAALGNRLAAAETSLREVITTVEAMSRPPEPPSATQAPDRPLARDSAPGAALAFAEALKMFRSGEHGQAVLELTDFVAKYPNHPLAPRAQLWIGDAYFKQRDYRQALLEYRKAVDVAPPDSPAAADAWLKIGQAYAALRERPAAAKAWQRVMREYPDTEAAGHARTLLRK